MPTEFFIWFDLQNPFTVYFVIALMGGLAFGETLSFILVYLILKLLKNTKNMSKTTIKMYRQFIALICVQVGFTR
jgi:hypothetical protein